MDMMPSQNRSRAGRITSAALFASLALIFSYIEVLIPPITGIPGVKLGIANLVVITALYRMDLRTAFGISVIRIIVAGLLFNGVFGALYSFAGGMISLFVMWALKKTGIFSMTGVSMAGGVAHNMGQLLVAACIVSNLKIFFYMPVLLFSGIISGILIGLTAELAGRKIPDRIFRGPVS